VAAAQPALAEATGDEAATLAQTTQTAVQTATNIRSAADDVSSALDALTGPFAPARVAFALAFLLVLASFVAFDIVSVDVDAGSPPAQTVTTTTETTPG
jgi:hypothetical protein